MYARCLSVGGLFLPACSMLLFIVAHLKWFPDTANMIFPALGTGPMKSAAPKFLADFFERELSSLPALLFSDWLCRFHGATTQSDHGVDTV